MNEGPDKRKEDKRRNDEHGKEGMRGGIRRFGGIMAEQEQEYR